jgi:regulator of sigma E protease
MLILLGILGLALLMVVHEGGHYLVARAFGMRVLKFSIGFGPVLWKYQPRGSDTVFQVALIPFLAYVQVAGMNPFEEVDPNDRSSYANASVFARISTIFAGPLANYLFASVLFFAAVMIGGKSDASMTVNVTPDGAAKAAKLQDGDTIVAIDGKPVTQFTELQQIVVKSPNKPLKFEVEREGKRVPLTITPLPKGENGGGLIGVIPREVRVPVPVSEAALYSLIVPAQVVKELVVNLARIVTFQLKPDLMGPPGIVKVVGKAAERGWGQYLELLGVLSAYLGGFNLVPFPALDGGRLVFLGYEATTRRRPDAKVEANVHFVGLVMLLLLITVVSVRDLVP